MQTVAEAERQAQEKIAKMKQPEAKVEMYPTPTSEEPQGMDLKNLMAESLDTVDMKAFLMR